MQSMTGFGSSEKITAPFGKIRVEARSTNHKFLETVFHLPEGFLYLEDRIKKEIEKKIKRGRIICAIFIARSRGSRVSINKALLKNYLLSLKTLKKEFKVKEEVGLDTLINLPGVLTLCDDKSLEIRLWPQLKALLSQGLNDLVKTRQKEGGAIYNFLKNRAEAIDDDLNLIKLRFKKAIKEKSASIQTNEERVSFLKETDITEEIERLGFHIRSFQGKLKKAGAIGKELDFIAQEMQREANTLGAKSFDVGISARVVQIKSQIEKIREQVQNVE